MISYPKSMKWNGQESNGLIFTSKIQWTSSIQWDIYQPSHARFLIRIKSQHCHWPQTGVSPVSGHHVLKVHPGSTRASEMLGVSWCLQ
jgi:hypothetical protein